MRVFERFIPGLVKGASVAPGVDRPLEPLDQGLERRDLVVQGLLAGLRELDPGAGASALVSLVDRDQTCLLRHAEVLRQVAGGEIECGAEEGELHASGFLSHSEDA
jgi:hypothetical protein